MSLKCVLGENTEIMQQDIPWKLLEKHFARKTSAREISQINKWKALNEENLFIFAQLEVYFLKNGKLPIEFSPNIKAARKKVYQKAGIRSLRISWGQVAWRAAASIVLLVGCWWAVQQFSSRKPEPQFVTITTSDTTQTMLTLPDSSHVWVNAGSSITYPAKTGALREVFLKGEAYFEVAHDTAHPFVIHAGKTTTRVLGTKFNIRSYPAENLVTLTVTEGKVSFGLSPDTSALFTLGQMGVFDLRTGSLQKAESKNPNFLAWKTREFYFENMPLDSVFKTLGEVYHFNYRFAEKVNKSSMITARFNNRPLAEIVETIAASANLTLTLQNRIYIINQ
jgi:transmembrane sensor